MVRQLIYFSTAGNSSGCRQSASAARIPTAPAARSRLRLVERVIENRDRSIRLMSHHIFRIAEAFLETAIDDVEYWVTNANVPPPEGSCVTGEEIAAYGDGIIGRVEVWWKELDDKSCSQKVRTFYGRPPLHQLFERSTWHSAQHVRQLLAVLERFGIEPSGPLTSEDLAGLPLPEGLWE